MTPNTSSSKDADRLPPGQYLARDFPVLHVGSPPHFDEKKWRLRIFGEVETPVELTWSAFTALKTKQITTDIHCVTRWSKFDTVWEGVPFADVIQLVKPKSAVRFVVTHGANGYTANVPLDVANDDDVLLAWRYDRKPLEPVHGGPMRMFVPKRYFWKSTKWCDGVEFINEDRPGFWEVRGYNNSGDPWKEERYW
ncbi:MAG TPA: sulfite oxidase-like oxidoreductase [Candidatus Eremiobacteraceae bacterium]|nr:sulfite oxidase-like oxidoreductase [Candidatus Eremiobacteraceae bacterium]